MWSLLGANALGIKFRASLLSTGTMQGAISLILHSITQSIHCSYKRFNIVEQPHFERPASLNFHRGYDVQKMIMWSLSYTAWRAHYAKLVPQLSFREATYWMGNNK